MPSGRRLLYAIITVTLFLLLAETTARLLPPPGRGGDVETALRFGANPELLEGNEHFWRRDPHLFWRLRPHLDDAIMGVPLRTNAGGFRDAEHPGAPVPGRTLIACVGDSTTFGWKVRAGERFTDLLPGLLAGRMEPPPLVLNFGQTGYSTVQAARLLDQEVLPLQPDVVVFVLGANDYGAASGRPDALQPATPPASAAGSLRRALQHSAFYRRLARRLGGLRDGPHAPTATAGAAGILRRVPEAEFAARLRGLVAAARDAGARPVLVTYPRRPLNPLLPCPVPSPGAGEDMLRAWDAAVRAAGEPLRERTAQVLELPAPQVEAALAVWDGLPPDLHGRPSFHYGRAYILQRAGRGDEASAALGAVVRAAGTEAAAARGEVIPAAGQGAPGTQAAGQGPVAGCEMELFSTALFRYREQPVAARYNAIIRDVAAATGTPLVDAAALLARAQKALVAGEEDPVRILELWYGAESYFADVVHPAARGHALMAEALAEVLLAAPGGA